MHNMAMIKRIVALWVSICMIVSSLGLAAMSYYGDGDANTEFPDGKLIFSGFTLQYGTNGKIQGIVDVSIENVDMTGVDFTLNYDSNFLVPSNFETNDPETDATKIFSQNTAVFPKDDIAGTNYLGFGTEADFSKIDTANGTIRMNLYPEASTPLSDYIGESPYSYMEGKGVKCVKAAERRVSLGRMSFQITNPVQVCNMTPTQLNSILSCAADDAFIIYVASDGVEGFVDVIETDWQVNRTLSEVRPTVNERTVSAYSIYDRCADPALRGTEADLFAYLNQTMRTVVQMYTDGQQTLGNIIWDPSVATVTYSDSKTSYDPLGDITYTITQEYGGTGKNVTVKVHVTPVTITGFSYDNKVKVYGESGRPQTWADLEMPLEITPVLTGIDDMYVPPVDHPTQADWTPNDITPALINGVLPVSETYTHTYTDSTGTLVSQPWLTVPSGFDWNITVERIVYEGEVSVDEGVIDSVAAKVIRESGILEITIPTIGGNAIDPGTDFYIYLPNGMIINTADNSDFVTVSVDGSGEATIQVNAMFTTGDTATVSLADRELIQSLINLGSTKFEISAKFADGKQTSLKPFEFDPRVNYYLYEDTDISGNNYVEKDYSQGRAGMFPVYEGQSLSDIATYIAFPDNSTIPVAYNGNDGYQPSSLDVAKVVSWEIEGDPSATVLPTQGTDVTLIGKLEDYSYTNFGYVKNADNVYLKIKVTTLVNPVPTPGPTATPTPTPDPSASPTPTPSTSPTPVPGEGIKITTVVDSGVTVVLNEKTFEYNTHQVGYSTADVQKQVYTIENIGTENINGLTLRISDFIQTDGTQGPNSSPTSFVNHVPLYVNILNVGDTATFAIRTLHGLPVGTYEARVSVGSNKNAEVAYFNISFKVTENPVYKVTVDNGDAVQQSIGLGYLMDSGGTRIYSFTYNSGDTVPVYVEILDTGYSFDEWTSNPSGLFTTATAPVMASSFVMPPQDTIVTPTYRESTDVWVRLADLRDYNPDNTLNPLRNSLPPYPILASGFSETMYDYRTMVDGTIEKNYVEFDVKDELLNETPPMTVTMTLDGNPLPVTPNGAGAPVGTHTTTTYKTDLFDLHDGANIVTIKTEYLDPSDLKTYSKTYTLTIYRKQSVSVTMLPGNSPYGLIESSDNIAEADKSAAKTAFSANYTYDPAYTPDKAVKTYNTKYYTDAWTGTNYDENPYALFVYSGTNFVDPGFKDLKDMDGNAVTASDVKRTIEKVNTLTGGITNIADLQTATQQDIAITNTGEQCLITELAALTIRPGVYTLKYTFTDADGSSASFTRPIIVLSRKGDVNLDRTTDTTDADMLYQRLNNDFYKDIISGTDDWTQLYAYRIGDATEDRNVNSVDANAALNIGGSMTQYYEELPDTLGTSMATFDPTAVTRPAVPTLPPDKATLVLDYLGTGSRPSAKQQTPNLTADNVYDADDPTTGLVWFGIGIKDTANLQYFLDGLYSADFAIDYDPEIFEPCDGSRRISTDADFNLAATIRTFNTTPASTTTTSDVEQWRNADLYDASLQTDIDFDADDIYKTEFVTIKSTDGTNLRLSSFAQPAGTDTIYLLRVPFRLKKLPESGYTGTAITLNLTEQTFVLGATADGVTNSASWEGVIDKTTDVNNAKNHFDGPVIVDIFGTDGKFNITGTIKAWNVTKPFCVEIYKTDNTTGTPDYTFKSDDVDPLNVPLYGTVTQTTLKGECEWEFSLPVSNLFDYRMVISKQSHLTYPELSIDRTKVVDNELAMSDKIELIVGDINRDQIIKLPDRAELMRFFNAQKPWALYVNRFEAADLNGDDAVNLFDLTLLKQNLEREYPQPTPVPTAAPGGGS